MKNFFTALKKIAYHKNTTYVNSNYKLHYKEKRSLLIVITLCLTPVLIGIIMLIIV